MRALPAARAGQFVEIHLIADCPAAPALPALPARPTHSPSSCRSAVQVACIALLAGPLGAFGQGTSPDQADTPTPQPSSVQRVEIAGRQGATDLRRAASVAKQIYGREEIDQYGDTNALDVLRRLPGVNVGAGGPRMRGLGAGYTLILINGDPAPQGFALDQLSPSQIERIEVLRAPTADQSAQAIAGSINIILKDAPRRSQRDLRLGLTDGSRRPMGNVNLTLGESKGPLGLSLPISLFEWRRENINTIDQQMPGTDGLPARSQQIGHQPVWGWGYNLGPRLNWKFSDEQSLSLQSFAQKGYWYNRSEYENRIFAGQPVLEDDAVRHGTWQNLRGNLVWTNRFRNDQRVELRAGVQQSKWSFDVQTQRQGIERLRSVGGGIDEGITQAGKYSWLLGQDHSLTVGWDLEARQREERRTTTQLGVPLLADFEGQPFEARVRRQAFYVQDEWEISPQLQMYLGLRNERIRTTSQGDAATVVNDSQVLSPLWHLTYKLDPKGRDMIRASLTRSYKAPNLGTLLARPTINSQFINLNASNTELLPDRIGNPALAPELATGLDIAFEKYLPAGGLVSVGVFHRQITGLVRTVTTLQPVVVWAKAPRWVARPLNFSAATTSGIELEVKGRASELMPALATILPADAKGLNLRASVNFYRSRVAALPGPDNRLDGQQPWSATLGFDNRLTSLPLNVGGSLSLNPPYDTQLTLDQLQRRSRTRTIDVFGQWIFRPGLSMRLAASAGVQPFGPPNGYVTTLLANGDYSRTDRQTKPQFNLTLDVRL